MKSRLDYPYSKKNSSQTDITPLIKGDFYLDDKKPDAKQKKYQNRKRSDSNDFKRKEEASQQQEGDSQRKEGGFRRREEDFRHKERGFRRREGDFRHREGGPPRREGDYRHGEGGSQRREGGYLHKEEKPQNIRYGTRFCGECRACEFWIKPKFGRFRCESSYLPFEILEYRRDGDSNKITEVVINLLI